jgi:hypothetical protein
MNYIFHSYDKKILALDDLSKFDKCHLFSTDKFTDGSKIFHVANYDTIYDKIIKATEPNCYENYNNEQPIKFFLDIDYKLFDQPDFDPNMINKILDDFNIVFSRYGYNNYPIIILNATIPSKFSYHLIFPSIIFNSVKHIKHFLKNIKSEYINDLIDRDVIDLHVYGNTCFRLNGCSKMGKNNVLKLDKVINYEITSDKQLFMDTLLLNFDDKLGKVKYEIPASASCSLPRVSPVDEKIIGKSQHNDKINVLKQINETLDIISLDELSKILNLIDIKRADSYDEWLKIGMGLKNSNSKSFNLWVEWSKKSKKFSSDNDCIYKWNTFTTNQIKVGTLKYYAKLDSADAYSLLYTDIDKPIIHDSTKIHQEYLLMNQDSPLKSNSCLVRQKVNLWMDSMIKMLIIKSFYGTGKTKLINKLITEYDIKRVLFVSYRKTLTNNLYGVFSELKFEKYTDKKYNADRFICQIDSLPKIANYYVESVPHYDLIVLDEIESILNHFNANTLKEKEYVFDYLNGLIHNANKCIMLDGDISNRSLVYAKSIDENYMMIENDYIKSPLHYIFTKNESKFIKKIDDDLKSGKKIVIVSMSSAFCLNLADKYKDGLYKLCVHYKDSDDEQFEKLIDVNKFWTQFDFVMYSPTIEGGVDFNVPYFDKMYCVLSGGSTSQRGFMQMTARVRQLKETNVWVYLNHIPFKEKCFPFTHYEVKNYFLSLYSSHLKKHIVVNKKNEAYVDYENSLYNEILIYNLLEEQNKNVSYFVPILLDLMKSKGHIYELDEDIIIDETIDIKHNKITQYEIINASDIDQSEFDNLLIKQNSSSLKHTDKIQMERFLYKKTFNGIVIDEQFMKNYYRKFHVISNMKYLFKDEEAKVKSFDYEYMLNYDKIRKLEQKTVVLDLISKFGYTLDEIKNGTDKKLSNEKMQELVVVFNNFFTKNMCQLFNLSKSKKIDTVRSLMLAVGNILNNFGININYIKKTIRKDGKRYNENYYSLLLDDNYKF